MTITGANDAATAVDDTGGTDEDTTLNAIAPGVLANDSDSFQSTMKDGSNAESTATVNLTITPT